MEKKRKHSETVVAENEKMDDTSFRFRNKEKVLVTCSRRINFRYRHLMLNVVGLLPHCMKDNKVDVKESKSRVLNELVELRSCSSCLFFENRTGKDLYLWMAKCPDGPSVKFLVNAVHTMEELKLTGSQPNGSRPFLTFSSNFDKSPHWKLIKEMISQIFGTPKGHKKSKPYHDQVFVFSIVDDHIWFRNYQILGGPIGTEQKELDSEDLEKLTLVEAGPRFCLNPLKIFSGSFGGLTLYENPFYVSPNTIGSIGKRHKAVKYAKKVKAKTRKKMHELENPLEVEEFDDDM